MNNQTLINVKNSTLVGADPCVCPSLTAAYNRPPFFFFVNTPPPPPPRGI
ncbi:MAG: hypothetical protein LBV16_09680 [Elusimicrobiota bacterium]|nr:hypothetical protein [Elusimicrobiota bacterium]